MKKLTLLFTAIWTALLLVPSVHAADITLGPRCALADAIIAANHDRPEGDCPAGRGADIITLTQDITLRDELPAITSAITIEGEGYAISGAYRWRIFYNDGGALTIKDLTMTDGYVEGDIIRNADDTLKATADQPFGGAIVNWQGTLSIINSSFSDNLAEYHGGAIVNWQGTLTINDSIFSHNLATGGGAIYNAGELSISDSSFSDNSAEYHGGAIVNWEESELSIVNSSFSRNSAGWGGAIANDGELSVSDSSFSDNSADTGGAIASAGELSVSDSSFSRNSADTGGAIFNVGGELSIVNSTFSDNSADDGGAIVNYSELSIGNSAFSGNSAEAGGAIASAGELSVSDSTFSDNLAEAGGAIVNTGELSSVNSTFSDNSADGLGGAIASLVGELSIINSAFSGNSADIGGAILNWENGNLSMVNSIIAGRGEDACESRGELKRNISNFIQDGSCSPAFKGDPMLGELVVPEDGSPAYFPLLAGSPVIGAADAGYCPETDQIGTTRPQGAGCDIGAIEYVAN